MPSDKFSSSMSTMIWPWLFLSYISLIILGFSDNLRGPLFYDIINHFHITDTRGALFFSTSSLLAFCSSLMAIPLLKKISTLQLLQIALFCMALSVLGLSQAPAYWMFLFSAGLLGVSMGFMGVAQNSLATKASPEKYRGQVISGLHSMYGIASFLAPLSVGLVKGWKWNDFFILASLMAASVTVLSFFMPKAKVQAEVQTAQQVAAPLNKKVAFWISGMAGFYVIAEILVGTRLSLYSIREFGISTSEASHYVTGFFIGLLSGRLVGILVRWPSTFAVQMACSIAISLVGYGLGLYVHPWFFVMTGVGMSIFYPTSIAYGASLFRGREGMIFSFIIAAQSILIVSMHLLVGYVSDLVSLTFAFHLGLIFLVICGFCLWRCEVENSKR